MITLNVVAKQLARYWDYMIGLNTAQRLLWFVVMVVCSLFLALANKFLLNESKIGGYFSLIPLIAIFTPVHFSVVFPKKNEPPK